MHSDPIQLLRDASKGSWLSPLSGVEYEYRRLGKADLLDCPEAFPIFDLAVGMALQEQARDPAPDDPLAQELAKRKLAAHVETLDGMEAHEAKITEHLIRAAMLRPRVLPDPTDFSEEPPPDALFYYQVPQIDRINLTERIRTLMAGLDALERRVAAARAASFREVDDRETDAPTEPAPDQGVEAVGDRERDRSARV